MNTDQRVFYLSPSSDHRADMASVCFKPSMYCLVWEGQKEIRVTGHAFLLLNYLVTHVDKGVLTHDELEKAVWGQEGKADVNGVRGLISVIRKWLQDDSKVPRFIRSVSGEGYMFIGQVQDQLLSERGLGATNPATVDRPHPHRRLVEQIRQIMKPNSRMTLCIPSTPGFLFERVRGEILDKVKEDNFEFVPVQCRDLYKHNLRCDDFLDNVIKRFQGKVNVPARPSDTAVERFFELSTILTGQRYILWVEEFDYFLRKLDLAVCIDIMRRLVYLECPTVVTSLIRVEATVRGGFSSRDPFEDINGKLVFSDWDEYSRSFGLDETTRKKYERESCSHPDAFEDLVKGLDDVEDRKKRTAVSIWEELEPFRESLRLIAEGNPESVREAHADSLTWAKIARIVDGKLVLWDPGWAAFWPPRGASR